MPSGGKFSEILTHDANLAANEFVSYAAVWFAIEHLKLENYIFSSQDNELITACKSAGTQVAVNELLRLLRRYGISFTPFK